MSASDPKAFADPPAAFRPLQISHGFDTRLTDRENLAGEEGIDRYLEHLKALGVGGIVANVGYEDYLQSPRQWEIWRHGAAKAVELGMKLWFYDERHYPSGSAGGVVTRAHPEYTAVGLACYTRAATGGEQVLFDLPVSAKACEGVVACPAGGKALPDQTIDLREHLDDWDTLNWTPPEGRWTIYYFARRTMFEGTFATTIPHGITRMYIDVLNPDAVRAFLRVTHEAYLRETPPEIWKQIDAVFTDEPLLIAPYVGTLPSEREGDQPVLDQPHFQDRPPSVIWTPAFAERFQEIKGYDLRPHLRSLFAGETDHDRYVRQDYRDVATRLYTRAYHQQIADWCLQHDIASSGHVLAEEGLHGNIMFEGSLMAVVRPMHWPGIDMLSADPEDVLTKHLLAPKAVSSVAHLTGREVVQCETSAHNQRTSGRDTSIAQWRGQANVLYAMGVNCLTLYHHWRGVGEDGYRSYNDYVGRLSLMLRGGCHVCDVAVLYPVRSGWSWWVPWGRPGGAEIEHDQLDQRMSRVARRYHDACLTLVQSQVDFDLVDEQAIQEARFQEGAMRIAEEAYRAVVLPGVESLELATLKALSRFEAAGGKVIRLWETPSLADSEDRQAEFDGIIRQMFDPADQPLDSTQLVREVRSHVEPDLELTRPDEQICYVHRRRGKRDIYFIANNRAEAVTVQPRLRAEGPWKLMRPLTGGTGDAPDGLEIALAPYEGIFLTN